MCRPSSPPPGRARAPRRTSRGSRHARRTTSRSSCPPSSACTTSRSAGRSCMEQGDSPYDAFLDEYEPGMTTAEVKAVFDVLRPELIAIVREAGEPRRRLLPRRRLPARDAGGVPRRHPARLRVRGRHVPARSDRASVRDHVLAHRHPDDDALQARQPARALVDDARGGARPHLPGHRAGAGALAAVRERLARARRVAEPDVGEPRRPLAAVLARPALPSCSGSSRSSKRSTSTTWYRGHQPRRARADPRRRRRGHLLAPHHPPLRARAGARRRLARARRPARGLEREDGGAARRRGAGRRARRPPGRALDARRRTATSPPTPSATCSRCRSGARSRRSCRTSTRSSRRASSARCTSRCASASTGTGASSRRWRRSSARSAPTRSTRSRTSRTCARRSRRSQPA